MRISIVTPAPPGSRYGNRVTAIRWARILKKLGHRVTVAQSYQGEPSDLLVALHARKSFESIARLRRERPDCPIIVALTGTDLYDDIRTSKRAQKSLDLATRLVVLQSKGIEELPPELRLVARVIHQSVARSPSASGSVKPRSRYFNVCVIGHLRAVKDPFRTALAARQLPGSSRVRVLHAGGAMSDAMLERARAEMEANSRYRWLGEQPQWRVRRILAASDL